MQPTGTPCWIDLQTDLKQAMPFYASVLGWTFEPMSEAAGFQRCLANGALVAAMGPGEPDAGWTVYIRTEDIDASVAGAADAGAQISLPPGDVGELGRTSMINAPDGLAVWWWQPGTHDSFDSMGPPGTPVWFECYTWQRPEIAEFFGSITGLEHERMGEMDYSTVMAEGRPMFGIMQMTEEWKGRDPSWMVYFAVEDTDAAAERVLASGGKVPYGCFDTPVGRIAICSDPMGTPFTVMVPA